MLAAQGQTLRVTTWNLKWFPSGQPNNAPENVEQDRIDKAAAILRPLASDVILLQEIRDGPTCERLILALRPEAYHLVVCSNFKDAVGGIPGRQQVAIISKLQATAAWAERWKTYGAVDPPRGFAFAVFRLGTNDVAVYSVHLKSNLTRSDAEREHQLNMLKRELASEQLRRHMYDVQARLGERLEAVIIGGDFNTSRDTLRFVSEATIENLNEEGFLSGYERIPLSRRITCPGEGRYPDATFDYIFTKGIGTAELPTITQTPVSDHFPVTRTVTMGKAP